jgi:hypothetical protein
MKLSGKRTVTYFNPGKTEVTSLGTEGDKSRSCRGIISQVKRQGEGDRYSIVLPLFVLTGDEYG